MKHHSGSELGISDDVTPGGSDLRRFSSFADLVEAKAREAKGTDGSPWI
jgi:hypothetical protein